MICPLCGKDEDDTVYLCEQCWEDYKMEDFCEELTMKNVGEEEENTKIKGHVNNLLRLLRKKKLKAL